MKIEKHSLAIHEINREIKNIKTLRRCYQKDSLKDMPYKCTTAKMAIRKKKQNVISIAKLSDKLKNLMASWRFLVRDASKNPNP